MNINAETTTRDILGLAVLAVLHEKPSSRAETVDTVRALCMPWLTPSRDVLAGLVTEYCNFRFLHVDGNPKCRAARDPDDGCFDSIPHAQLMRSVARRVSDRHVLARVKQWLVAPVEEPDGRGGWRRTTRAKDTKQRDHGSRTEARSESDGIATGPYSWRASPRLYTDLRPQPCIGEKFRARATCPEVARPWLLSPVVMRGADNTPHASPRRHHHLNWLSLLPRRL